MVTNITKMKKYPLHPACQLFPQLGNEELHELAIDIKAHGLQRDIVLCHGKILDGRNRYLACGIARVKPTFVEWKGKGSPLEWVISENLIRRHLTSSQRAVLALDLLPLLEIEARKRHGLCKNLHDFSPEDGKSSQIAARMTKTNSAYVRYMKSISKNAPELTEKVRAGLLGIPDATKLARLPASERKKILLSCNGSPITAEIIYNLTKQIKVQARERAAKAYAKTGKGSSDEGILIGDMDLLSKKLDNKSVDLFLTDPPYNQIELYERLAELAAAKLKPGGLCLAYSGQFHLPAILEAMGKHLTYWWTFAIEFSGQHCAIQPRHIQNKWKPILAFAKPPLKPAGNWLTDILHGGGRDKEHHDWGQHESEVEYLIEKLTEPGQLVVDPFCGGGQIPAVCKATGRRWLASEINKTTALIARKRLGERASKK